MGSSNNDRAQRPWLTLLLSRRRCWEKRHGAGGIILTKKFKKSRTVPSIDAHHEQEVLIPGIVTGAKVEVIN